MWIKTYHPRHGLFHGINYKNGIQYNNYASVAFEFVNNLRYERKETQSSGKHRNRTVRPAEAFKRLAKIVKKITVCFANIVACLLLLSVISFPSLIIAQDIKVYDQDYDLKYRIKGDRIFDKDWNLRYRNKGDKIYDKDWNLKYSIEGDKIYDKDRNLRYHKEGNRIYDKSYNLRYRLDNKIAE